MYSAYSADDDSLSSVNINFPLGIHLLLFFLKTNQRYHHSCYVNMYLEIVFVDSFSFYYVTENILPIIYIGLPRKVNICYLLRVHMIILEWWFTKQSWYMNIQRNITLGKIYSSHQSNAFTHVISKKN